MVSVPEISMHMSDWNPETVQVTLNARIDAKLVPHGSTMRLDYSHVVVLDNFIGESERQSLLDLLTQPDWDHSQGPPTSTWERETADGAGLPKTWGLKDSVLQVLAKGNLPAVQEVHTRLAMLYPEYVIAHMPSQLIQHHQDASTDQCEAEDSQDKHITLMPPQTHLTSIPQDSSNSSQIEQHANDTAPGQFSAGSDPSQHDDSICALDQSEAPVDCNQFVGNAAVYGDCYTWHVDADPAAFPSSPWVDTFGHYCNGEPGRPLFVSLLLYLDDKWPRQWDAETLFLDDDTDIGIVVRPKQFRAVLMDQDVLHRVSTPSQLAGARPRYSLVWKLIFMPQDRKSVV